MNGWGDSRDRKIRETTRVTLCALLLTACDQANVLPPPPLSAGSPPSLDAAAAVDATQPAPPSSQYPAAHAEPPRVQDLGGPVLTAPNIVPIFFSGDALEPQLEQFLAQMVGSSYWSATTTEYGVGTLRVSPSIVVSDAPPSSTTDTEVETWLASYIEGQGNSLIDASNIYVVFYPEATTISRANFGTSCVDFGSFHAEVSLQSDAGSGAVTAPYAVIPRCANFNGFSGIDLLTVAASHEIIESSTDPLLDTNPAYALADDNDCVWDFEPAAEVADMCTFESSAYQRLVGSFLVQRSWSNKAAAANEDPCVPPTGDAYFNAAPDLMQGVAVVYPTGQCTTPGIVVPVGSSKTVDVKLFSTGPTPAWQVVAQEVGLPDGGASTLAFQWGQGSGGNSGSNGDVLMLTITRTAPGPLDGTEFVLYSEASPTVYNPWYGFVGN